MELRKHQEIDQKHIWHPFSPLNEENPIFIKRGNGCYLETEDGNQILDAISSWWVNIHGHSHPKIAKSIAKQAKKLEQVIFAGFTHKPAIQLTEQVLNLLPGFDKIFFSDNGSTSTEVALKLGIQYWKNRGDQKRIKIIAIDGAYHGDTFGAMSLGGKNTFTLPFSDYLFEVEFIPFPDSDGSNTIERMKEIADKDCAVFIFEPLVQGASGMRMYDPKTLDILLEIAHENEIVTVADEVMTGFGRTGKVFAIDYLKNKPDIICLSKGISGGFLPIGLTVMNSRIVQGFTETTPDKTFFHGHSFTGNPMACAACVTSIKLLNKKKCISRIQRISELQKEFVNQYYREDRFSSIVKNVRSTGTVLAVELISEDPGYTSTLKDKIYRYFMSKNILLRPLGHVIYFLPPYIITDEEIMKVHDEIINFLNEY